LVIAKLLKSQEKDHFNYHLGDVAPTVLIISSHLI